PLVALSKKEQWKLGQTLKMTIIAGSAHVLSTILIGIVISILSFNLSSNFEAFTRWISPLLLIGLGIFFLYQHYHHHHFQIDEAANTKSVRAQMKVIVIAMFFSPCLEIEALYILAGNIGWSAVFWLSLLYLIVTLIGMVFWVYIVYKGLERLNKNWHRLEHNSGIIA